MTRTKLYYHGTSNEKNALLIINQGILPDLSKTKGTARPVDGRVYATINIVHALPYLLGGAMAGHDLPKDWIEESRYGYLFIIKGEDLEDIQPDEDQIGQAVHDKAFPWVDKYLDLISEEEPENSDFDEEEGFSHRNLLSQVNLGEYAGWIKAGHLLLKNLTQSEMNDVIEKYGNVAHLGVVYPVDTWKFDKLKCPQLKEDGSNFFELAELISK
jgi:hypothetical protein